HPGSRPSPLPILTATNISHSYGDRPILREVSLSIEPNDRIGIVGRNGAGKTTLMKVLTGELKPDSGTVALQRGSRAGYLTQDHRLDPAETLRQSAEGAFAELHAVHRELDELFEAMATAQGDALELLLKKQVVLETQMEKLGGYSVDHLIGEVLHGLGFTDSQFEIKVGNLSGGQKGRLALARLLLEQPDVLLLDEPTNHLDIEGRIWLEEFLRDEYKGAVVMISHDRYLLDTVVNRIIETEQCRLIDYPGNYLAFRELRAERRMVMHRAYEAQQHKFKKEADYIRRYKAGQRAKQAKGRETRLERAKEQNTLERPMEHAAFKLSLPKAERTGDMVASARGASKSYTNSDGEVKVLFRNLDLTINRGERWGIIGPNGAGKTTLVNTLLGLVQADSGIVRLGSNVKVGHYRQTHEHVVPEESVYRYIQGVILREAPTQAMSEQQARNLAGAFLFSGEEQERLMGNLSGGERSRAVLAGLLASAKNVLVLDEPTNHLDIPSAERLEEALAVPDEDSDEDSFDGTLLLISHDRALIDATCDHLLVLDGEGNAEFFVGGFTEWHEKHLAEKSRKQREVEAEKNRRDDADRRRRQAEEAKKKPVAKPAPSSNGALARLTTEQLEGKIEKVETRLRAVDAELADPAVWRDKSKSDRLGSERTKLVAELQPLEFEWARRAADAE
ncbi:MAG: ABC-F family ATP-binding cassette domain-containing protein, partial [bacterium]|nr:ABC-F family ATP-binding cassette domain-containing protein [bacterium]